MTDSPDSRSFAFEDWLLRRAMRFMNRERTGQKPDEQWTLLTTVAAKDEADARRKFGEKVPFYMANSDLEPDFPLHIYKRLWAGWQP